MKRVLVTGGYNIGKAGVATIVYRWGQNFDSNILVYDYLMAKGLPDKQYIDVIEGKGGHIITPDIPLTLLKKIVWIFHSMANGKYDLIHINIDVAYKAIIYIIIARLAGIDKIALHSHCSFIDETNTFMRRLKIILHYLTRGYCRRFSTVLLACSKEAAIWMFGKRIAEQNGFKKIFNGIDINQFKYNPGKRELYRQQFEIGTHEVVLCNVGRFSYQKNHFLLIDIFEELIKENADYKLVLVGTGPLYEDVIRYVNSKGLSDKVLFMGQRNDVDELLNMMDIFVLPSRFEGLPLVLVEAQVSMLPCVVSSAVSKETKISDFYEFIQGENLQVWVDAINKFKKLRREDLRIENIEQYSIQNSANVLQNILDSL